MPRSLRCNTALIQQSHHCDLRTLLASSYFIGLAPLLAPGPPLRPRRCLSIYVLLCLHVGTRVTLTPADFCKSPDVACSPLVFSSVQRSCNRTCGGKGDPTAPCPKSQKADSCPPVIGSTIF
ncbi:unnamed protein product [Chondrus crispus]|uniref:Uncharacterized protein n=1 Tax=Chondrus crispus TaxID=2769 RepID=R7QHS9_CHOCR|nr:unnamed protein product [Chondrus crispus]CDF38067.1 unnamed protein product [Chondrus crispus]|eukprot:XP_005717936.1 unnamed protein product [Chondrus crispus]